MEVYTDIRTELKEWIGVGGELCPEYNNNVSFSVPQFLRDLSFMTKMTFYFRSLFHHHDAQAVLNVLFAVVVLLKLNFRSK